jgi:rhodanese-related sulfurtransferase/CBS domain-containing protein
MPIEIRRKDVKTLVAQGRAQLVEVLPPAEFKREHLPQAINLPLQEMSATTTKILRKDVAVIVYCADFQCDLSARAAWRLESMGFQEVYRYTPGKADWLAAGWETEGEQAKKTRIRQMIQRDVPTCLLRERLEDVKSRRRPNQDLCVVVNDRNIVLGVIRGEAWDANPLARVVDVMQPGPRTIRPDLEPKEAQKMLRNYDAPKAIVTTSDGELLGIIRIAQKKSQKTHKAA